MELEEGDDSGSGCWPGTVRSILVDALIPDRPGNSLSSNSAHSEMIVFLVFGL